MHSLSESDSRSSDIAIVGLAFQLPDGADTPDKFWDFLKNGKDGVGALPAKRVHALMDQAAPHAGYLEDVARFDASFFEMSGLEATYTDPAQRLLLTSTWHAIERAGIDPTCLAGEAVGVFAGCHTHDYNELAARLGSEVSAYWNTGLNDAMLANRISYFFDWHGPSVTFNTACSSGLEALVSAVYALRNGRCRTALVGGVNLILLPTVQTSAARAGMMSPQAKCRTFDAQADGFVRGEGVVCLLLKPWHDAKREGLPIWGTIRAAESCHGGRAANLTAPNLKRQRDLIQSVWLQPGIDASQAAFVEAHGTATKLGDSIEVAALREAFERLTERKAQQPAIGLAALKTQIGHLEAAAGLASIVKICLAMRHGLMPANLHFEKLNPILDLQHSPFYVVDQPTLWPQDRPLAGVSSFGFGGSYAHAVIAPGSTEIKPTFASADAVPLVLSAHKRDILPAMIADLQAFVVKHPQVPLDAVAALLCLHRKPLKYRWGALISESQPLAQINAAEAQIHEIAKTRRTPIYDDSMPLELSAILQHWLKGYQVPWAKLFPALEDETCRTYTRQLARDMPVYPFAGKSYWLK